MLCKSELDKTYYNAKVRMKLNIIKTLGVLVKQAEIEVVTSRFLKPDLVRTSEGKWQNYYKLLIYSKPLSFF